MANIIKFGGAGINKKTTGTYRKGIDFICVDNRYESDNGIIEVGNKIYTYSGMEIGENELNSRFTPAGQWLLTANSNKPAVVYRNGYIFFPTSYKNNYTFYYMNDSEYVYNSTGYCAYCLFYVGGIIYFASSTSSPPLYYIPSNSFTPVSLGITINSSYYTAFYYYNNVYIAEYSNYIHYSTNGTTWTDTSTTFSSANGFEVFGNYIYAGTNYSSNGKTWYTTTYKPIAYNNGVYLSYGGSAIQRSTDGKTWTAVHTTTVTPTEFHYNNGVWIGISSSNIWYSIDNGVTWAENTASYSVVKLFKGLLLAYVSSNYSNLYYSTDYGATWTSASGAYNVVSLVITDDLVFTSAYADYASMYCSKDGKVFERTSVASDCRAIGYYKNNYYAYATFKPNKNTFRSVLMRS